MKYTWQRKGYEVVMSYAGQFDIVKDGEVIDTIVTGTAEDCERIIADLNAGEDVNGWENGAGGVISIERYESEMRENGFWVRDRLTEEHYVFAKSPFQMQIFDDEESFIIWYKYNVEEIETIYVDIYREHYIRAIYQEV